MRRTLRLLLLIGLLFASHAAATVTTAEIGLLRPG